MKETIVSDIKVNDTVTKGNIVSLINLIKKVLRPVTKVVYTVDTQPKTTNSKEYSYRV